MNKPRRPIAYCFNLANPDEKQAFEDHVQEHIGYDTECTFRFDNRLQRNIAIVCGMEILVAANLYAQLRQMRECERSNTSVGYSAQPGGVTVLIGMATVDDEELPCRVVLCEGEIALDEETLSYVVEKDDEPLGGGIKVMRLDDDIFVKESDACRSFPRHEKKIRDICATLRQVLETSVASN